MSSGYSPKQLDAFAKAKGHTDYTAYLRAMHQERYRGKKTDWNILPTKKKPVNYIQRTMQGPPLSLMEYVARETRNIL